MRGQRAGRGSPVLVARSFRSWPVSSVEAIKRDRLKRRLSLADALRSKGLLEVLGTSYQLLDHHRPAYY